MAAIYRGMDRATLDAAYDNTGQVAGQPGLSRPLAARRARRSAPSRHRGSICASASGRAPRSTIFPAKPGAPLFVFIHGGYWQRNEKERFSFTALGPNAHDINVAVPGYTLAPDARLTDIVAEMRQALSFLAERAGEFGLRSRTAAGRRLVGGRASHRRGVRSSGGRGRIADQRHFRSRADPARRAQRQSFSSAPTKLRR